MRFSLPSNSSGPLGPVVKHIVSPSGDTTGVTDTAAIQANENLGRTTVLEPNGTYYVSGLVKKSYASIELNGATLKLPNGANTDVIVSEGFAQYTGTNTDGGIHHFAILGPGRIDGNKANNTSGHGIAIFGADFLMQHFRVANCADDGVLTEWADVSNTSTLSDAMESMILNVKSHDNGGYGFNIQGPHDGFLQECVAYNNGTMNFRFWNNAHGVLARSCHAWGSSPVSVSLEQMGTQWEEGDAETAQIPGMVCMQVLANDVVVSGKIWSPGTPVNPGPVGLVIGAVGGFAPSNLRANVLVSGTASGSIHFANSAGGNWIKANIWQQSGAVITGTPDSTDVIDIPTPRGGAVPDWTKGGGGELIRDVSAVRYTRHRAKLPDPGGTATWYRLGRWTAKSAGARLTARIVGSQGYNANQATNEIIDIVASIGNGAAPNITGFFKGAGLGALPVTNIKAVAVGGAGGGWQWDLYAFVSSFTGNSHMSVEVGSDEFPSTWQWNIQAAADPGAASSSVVTFTSIPSLGEFQSGGTGVTGFQGTIPIRDKFGAIIGRVPVYGTVT